MVGVRTLRWHAAGAWLAFALAALPAMLRAQEPVAPPVAEQVIEVRVVGNRAVSTAKVMRELKTRAGRPFNQEVVIEDVRKLARRGWFIDVKPLYEEVPGGRIVIFRVYERPILRYVKYLGNTSVRTSVLAKETGLKVGDAVDPYAIEEGRRTITEFYKSKGFNRVRVTVLEGSEPGDQGAVYVISEGQKQRVWKVQFLGNQIASDGRLKTQIESKPPILYLFKGYVDRQKIDEDVNRLTAYYRSLGYFSARIGRELDFNEEGDWLTLTFVIDEGPRYRVRQVSFIGNQKFSSNQLAAEMKLNSGDYFNQASMSKDVSLLRDIYGSQGHVFADIKADPRFLEEPGQLDLVYDIEEGARYRVGRVTVHVQGDNPHTRRQAVLNRVSLRTGDIVDIRKLRESERRLRSSGLFAANPLTGEAPRIVFSPPGSDGSQVARGKGRSGFRGQSPDTTPRDAWRPPPVAPGERLLNIEVYNENERPQPAAEKFIAPQPAEDFLPPPIPTTRPIPPTVRGQSPVEYSAPGPRGFAPGYGGQAVQPTGPAAQSYPAYQAAPPSYTGYPAVNRPASYPPASYPPSQPGFNQPSSLPSTGGNPQPGVYGQVGTQNPQSHGAYSPYGQGTAIYDDGPGGVPANRVALPGGSAGGLPYYPEPGYEPVVPIEVAPEALPFDVFVEETQTGRFMLGVGVNSDAGVVGSITVDEQNFDLFRWPRSLRDFRNGTAFRGAGQRFRLELLPGERVQRYLVSFQEPYLFDTPNSLGLSGFFFDRRYREWDEQRVGGRVSLGRQLTPDLSLTFAFRGEEVNIHDPIINPPPELAEVVGDNSLLGFKLSLRHDTRDSAFLATQGHYFELSGEQVIGDFEYPRAEIDVRQYFLVRERPDGSGRHVISVTNRVGFSGDDTPIYDRFYAGGFSTMRGFDFRGASPVDATGRVRVGGDFMFLGSVEYLFPITADDMIRGVTFVDYGTVEETVDLNDFRVAPGVGLRITIPAMGPAPIALDFAFPIVKTDFDDRQVFSFNIGFLR